MKKRIKLSNLGFKPLVFKESDDSPVVDTKVKERDSKISLESLFNKLYSDNDKSPSYKSIKRKRKDSRDSSYNVKVGEVYQYFTSIPSVLCNKCKYNSTCPYFARRQVCQFIASYFNSNRYIHKFFIYSKADFV